jgi:hypothetical protein
MGRATKKREQARGYTGLFGGEVVVEKRIPLRGGSRSGI